jgi:hypothetical protein
MKTALLTNIHLKDIGGSELYVFELAVALKDIGYDVHIVSPIYGGPMAKLFANHGLEVHGMDYTQKKKYDLLWVLHGRMAKWIHENKINGNRKIYMSCSPYEPNERPDKEHISFYDTFLANSEETKLMLISIGVKNPQIFLNSVTDEVINSYDPKKSNGLRSIAIVSHHIPQELNDAVAIFNQRNISVDKYGAHGGSYVYITGETIKKYDCIITIGRTIQYALCSGITAYCYDRFGGDGFITLGNIKGSQAFNFSGRWKKQKKTPLEIVNDVMTNYNGAFIQRNMLRDIAIKRYSLTNNIKGIL